MAHFVLGNVWLHTDDAECTPDPRGPCSIPRPARRCRCGLGSKNLMQKHRVAPKHVNIPLSTPVDRPVVDGSLKIPLSIELAIEALEARWRRGRKP